MILFIIFSGALIERSIFLLFREETNAEIINLKKSDNESYLIVELKYKVENETVFNVKKIKYSFYEDLKNKSSVKIYYNSKFYKSIYLVDYGSTLLGDIVIILIPVLLFIFALIGANRKKKNTFYKN